MGPVAGLMIRRRFVSRRTGGEEVDNVDNFSFGLSMTVVGMGGTLLSLWVLALFMSALKRLFPCKPDETEQGREGGVL